MIGKEPLKNVHVKSNVAKQEGGRTLKQRELTLPEAACAEVCLSGEEHVRPEDDISPC